VFWVMRDEDSLGGLDDDDSLFALFVQSALCLPEVGTEIDCFYPSCLDRGRGGSWKRSYLLAVKTPLVGLEYDKSLACDVETAALDALYAVCVSFVLVCGDDLLHLARANLWVVSDWPMLIRSVGSRLRAVVCVPGVTEGLPEPLLSVFLQHDGDYWTGRRTLKPEEVAQTLLPSELKIAALSTLPVPTRLFQRCQLLSLFQPCSSFEPSLALLRLLLRTSDRRMLYRVSVFHCSSSLFPRACEAQNPEIDCDTPCQDIFMCELTLTES